MISFLTLLPVWLKSPHCRQYHMTDFFCFKIFPSQEKLNLAQCHHFYGIFLQCKTDLLLFVRCRHTQIYWTFVFHYICELLKKKLIGNFFILLAILLELMNVLEILKEKKALLKEAFDSINSLCPSEFQLFFFFPPFSRVHDREVEWSEKTSTKQKANLVIISITKAKALFLQRPATAKVTPFISFRIHNMATEKRWIFINSLLCRALVFIPETFFNPRPFIMIPSFCLLLPPFHRSEVGGGENRGWKLSDNVARWGSRPENKRGLRWKEKN